MCPTVMGRPGLGRVPPGPTGPMPGRRTVAGQTVLDPTVVPGRTVLDPTVAPGRTVLHRTVPMVPGRTVPTVPVRMVLMVPDRMVPHPMRRDRMRRVRMHRIRTRLGLMRQDRMPPCRMPPRLLSNCLRIRRVARLLHRFCSGPPLRRLRPMRLQTPAAAPRRLRGRSSSARTTGERHWLRRCWG